MRLPEQRKGRACIRPEISRSRTFGRVGVSQGQFYDEHLQFIRLNDVVEPFLDMDIKYPNPPSQAYSTVIVFMVVKRLKLQNSLPFDSSNPLSQLL